MSSSTRVSSILWLGTALRLLAIGCAIALLSGCQPTMEEVIAEHRGSVEGVFSKLKALDARVWKNQPIAVDRIEIGTERVVLEGEESNALFILARDLKAPESASAEPRGAKHAHMVAGCGELLRGVFHGAPPGATHFLSNCGRAENVFVLRPHKEVFARLIDQKSFEPGMYEGDVLLFRLSDGALLGGFRVSAESSDEVVATADASGISLDIIDRLEEDVTAKVFAEIDAKLRKHVPGAIP